VIAVHLSLLPSGKVLTWGRLGTPQVWDPATGVFTSVPSPSWVFCAGHDFLADGRLLVTGGHIADALGLPDANIFDFATQSWVRARSMAYGRWYPTSTTLSNGEVLTIAGTDQTGARVFVPEVYQRDGTWRALTTAPLSLPYYPRTFVAPNGKVFYAGENPKSAWLDPSGTCLARSSSSGAAGKAG
jgi:hypothetical protein